MAYGKIIGRTTLYQKIGYTTLPSDSVRTEATRLGVFLSSAAESKYFTDHPEIATNDPTTFIEYVKSLPEHVQRFLGNLHTQRVDVAYWVDALRRGAIKIATDGSVAKKRGILLLSYTLMIKC